MKKLLATVMIVMLASAAITHQIGLVWEPNRETNLHSYLLYSGLFTHSYNTMTVVNTNSTITDSDGNLLIFTPVSNLNNSTTYYFAVAASNMSGLASAYSSEVSLTTSNIDRPPTALFNSFALYQGESKLFNIAISDEPYALNVYRILTQPTKGTIELFNDYLNSFRYTAYSNSYGYDVFSYSVSGADYPSSTNSISVAVLTTNLTIIAADASQIHLSYTPGQRLQYNLDLTTTNWTDIADTNMPLILSNSYPQCFFRIRPVN